MDQSQMNPSATRDLFNRPLDRGFIDQIKGELAEFSTAFSNVDIKTAASFFAADATLINPVGVRAMGRDQISQVMKDDLNGFLKGGQCVFNYESSRMLGADLAFVDIRMDVKGLQTMDNKNSTMVLHVASVMKKEGNRWLLLDARPYGFMPAEASLH